MAGGASDLIGVSTNTRCISLNEEAATTDALAGIDEKHPALAPDSPRLDRLTLILNLITANPAAF